MENLPYSHLNKIDIVKIAILLKAIYRFNTFHYKIPKQFFTEIEMPTVVRSCLFPAALTQDDHTENILFAILFGQ